MNINIKSKYLEQNKTYWYVEFIDLLNASHTANIEKIQLIFKKNNAILFNKILKLYKDFKIYIDNEEQSLYQLTKNYFPLQGELINHIDIDMNMEIAGNHENKVKSIKIYTNKGTSEDTELIGDMIE